MKPPFTMSKYKSREDLLSDAVNYYKHRSEELEELAIAMRTYIDAIPKDVVLPVMPGFDRDWADSIID